MAAVTWTLNDETVIRQGGKVEGHSPFAEHIRGRLDAVRKGVGAEWVSIAPPPGGLAKLDPSDDWHLDCWLRGIAFRFGVELVDPPDIQMPKRLRTSDDEPPKKGDRY